MSIAFRYKSSEALSLFSAYSINASWLGISQAKQEIARAKSQTCRADQEPHDHDAEHSLSLIHI